MKATNRPDIYWDSIAELYQRETHISLDDFHYGPLIAGEKELQLLPRPLHGQRCLELGCGAAQNSIWLAKQGAACTAIDCAEKQLVYARTLAADTGVELDLRAGEIAEPDLPRNIRYDLIHSSNALQFVDDPGGAIASAAARLAPGGSLVLSIPHPLFCGEWLELDEDGFGLFLPSYFAPQADIREESDGTRVVSRTHPVSTWCNWCLDAGLTVTRLLEPLPIDNPPYTSSAWESLRPQLERFPATLVISAQRTVQRER